MLERNKFLRILKSFFVVSLVLAGFVFTACEEEDDIEVKKDDAKIVISGFDTEVSIMKGSTIIMNVDVEDDAITGVSVAVDDVEKETFNSFPFDFTFNTSDLSVGNHSLKFVAYNGNKENGSKEITVEITAPITVSDYDGNVYQTVQIGSQIWMVENLKTTHYRNGDALSGMTVGDGWDELTSGGYCNYDNSAANGNTYGNLYNFYAVEDERELCPEGWHVPTKDDLKILIKYLGGADVAGGKMKEAGSEHWTSTLTTSVNEGTNESGFTALPGGVLDASGNFSSEGYMAWFWTSEGYDSSISGKRYGYRRSLDLRSDEVSDERGYHAYMGMSVRCIKD
jgi:uncharacterized protein (TIGR02145 family)